MTRKICIAAVVVLIGVASVPLLSVAKWIGQFTLTVNLDGAPGIDASSITYVECWDADKAQWLCNNRSEFVAGFEPPDTKKPNTHFVAITCTGDSGGYGLYDTYHQPEFLVVQYRMMDAADDDYARKTVAIPAGRGPRSTTLTLP